MSDFEIDDLGKGRSRPTGTYIELTSHPFTRVLRCKRQDAEPWPLPNEIKWGIVDKSRLEDQISG